MMASLPAASANSHRMLALIAGGCALAAGLIVLGASRNPLLAAGFAAAAVALAGGVWLFRRLQPPPASQPEAVDWGAARQLAQASDDALAVTDRAGRLVCANDAWSTLFDGYPTPPALPVDAKDADALSAAGRAAWRDGSATIPRLFVRGLPTAVTITLAGEQSDLLVWRFASGGEGGVGQQVEALIDGATGDRLGAGRASWPPPSRPTAGSAPPTAVSSARAMGRDDAAVEGRDFARFLITDAEGLVRFEREGLTGNPLRVLQIPFLQGDDAPILVALLDDEARTSRDRRQRQRARPQPGQPDAVRDRAGRSRRALPAHERRVRPRRAASMNSAPPLYPGDLFEREDKAAVADAVRRFAGGADPFDRHGGAAERASRRTRDDVDRRRARPGRGVGAAEPEGQ